MIDTAIEGLAATIAEDFAQFNQRFDHLETDVTELRSDVAELKVDMREVKWHLADTVHRSDFLDLRDRVQKLEHQKETHR
jgi:phage shock protein A